MRFLLSLLPIIAIASAAVSDYEIEDSDFDSLASVQSHKIGHLDQDQYHQELPFGVETAHVLNQLAKFDKTDINADRFTRYEVNPEFDFDNSRSLNLKMTPILNFQSDRLMQLSEIAAAKKLRKQKIMLKLMKVGIKPATVKKYIKLKKQGMLNVAHSPIRVMAAIQQGVQSPNIMTGESSPLMSDTISSSRFTSPLSSQWSGVQSTSSDVNAPYTSTNTNVADTPSSSMLSSPQATEVAHGFTVPNIQLANQLKDVGITISHTMTNEPAIEVKHLQKSLLQCTQLNWNSAACAKLQEFASPILGDTSTPQKLHNSIINLTNPQYQTDNQSYADIQTSQ